MIKKLSNYLMLLFSSVYALNAYAHGNHSQANQPYSKVRFYQNKGQWNSDAKFRADVPSGDMFLTDYGLVYNYANSSDFEKMHDMVNEGKSVDHLKYNYYAYKVLFKNANKSVAYGSIKPTKEYYNYIIGNDPSKWASFVYGFEEVLQSNIYNNIDVKYYDDPNGNGFKYDFIVKPNGNPNNIVLEFEGITPTMKSTGALKLDLGFMEVEESAPLTYQIINGEKVIVPSRYLLHGNKVSFEFPNGYDKTVDLVIDPSIIYATFSGGTGSVAQYAHTTTYDNLGNTYTCALSSGAGWPTTTGAYQMTSPASSSVGLHKYSVDGSQLIYGTYFGASSSATQPFSARVNDNYEIVLAGAITSNSLPTLPTSYDATLGGNQDIYLAKLSADGTTLLGSTYLGGSASECVIGIATTASYTSLQGAALNPIDVTFDRMGNIWVASNTASSDFPVVNAIQTSLAGGTDIIISQFNPNLSSLLFSTFYGGSASESAATIEFDNDFNVLAVGGLTNSQNFPILDSNAVNFYYQGGSTDGFVITLNSNTKTLLGSTYLGTPGEDNVAKLDFDCAGNIYICGQSKSGLYPVDSGVYHNPGGIIYIHKVPPTLRNDAGVNLRTTIGGSNTGTLPMGFMVDICGNVYVNTVTSSGVPGLPLTPDAIETNPRSFYMIVLEPSYTDLYFATYYGSSSGDHAHPGVHRLDEQGYAYASVCGTSTAFPTTPNSWSPVKMNASNDNIVFKFDFEARGARVTGESPEGGLNPNLHTIRGCKSAWLHFERPLPDTVPTTIKLEVLGDAINGVDYEYIYDSIVIPAFATKASLEIKALKRLQATGTKKVIINSFSMCSCNGLDMGERTLATSDTVLILDSIYVALLTPTDTSCPGDQISITAQIDPTLKFKWTPENLIPNPNSLTISPSPTVTTRFEIEVWQEFAPATCPPRRAAYTAVVEPFPVILIPNDYLTICYKDSLSMAMQVVPENPRYKYEWAPAQYFGNPDRGVTKFMAPIGEYRILLTATTPGAGCSTTEAMTIKVVPPVKIEGITPKDTVIKLGDAIDISVIADSSVMWQWTPADYLTDATTKTVTVAPKQDMVYTATVWDQYGCYDQIKSKIGVYYQSQIFVPNAFTPNGDGVNDVFEISNLRHDKLVSFKVYNRFGEELFETSNPNKGWDGTNKAGKPVPPEVYFYHIVVMGPLPNDQPVTIKGDVTLIR